MKTKIKDVGAVAAIFACVMLACIDYEPIFKWMGL